MFWGKNEKDKLAAPQILGKNYKFKHLKFYANAEIMFANQRLYRKIMEQEEVTYLNWEVAIHNKRFDDIDWKAAIVTKCYKIDEGKKEMCNTTGELNVTKDIDTYYYRYSWGTEKPGYWKAGIYSWEIYIDNELLCTETCTIYNFGKVTETNNPYFDLIAVKLYPCYEDMRETKEGYRYLTQFDANTTEYVGVELEVKVKNDSKFNYEFVCNVINDAGIPKTQFTKEGSIIDGEKDKIQYLRSAWGTPKPGFWKEDQYIIHVIFMDQHFASVAFTVGKQEIIGTPTILKQNETLTTNNNTSTTQPEKSTQELLKDLEELIGMEKVKQSIQENIAYLQFNKVRMDKGFKDDSALNIHSVFKGNPGTGKTTIVRLLGQIYRSMGLLSKGHVVEVGRAELIAEYIGQTAPKVKKAINDARGGILFIDEAYALSRGSDSKIDYGQEAIEVLLKEMSDGIGDIAIVAAGYPAEMNTFITSNPGLQSRFKQNFYFEDYLPEELFAISQVALKKEEVDLDIEAEKLLKNYLTEQYRNRDKSFGNARMAYSIIDEAKKQMGIRLLKKENFSTLSKEEISTILSDDLQAIFRENNRRKLKLTIEEKELKAALNELNELVGLQAIKKEIEDMTQLVRFYSETGKDILHKFSLHAVLMGNPGTGKTTLARILAKIYKALGLLERGHVVEVDRQELVAAYIGQTAIKTANIIDKAMGGVLFIDEAYALASGSDNDFGNEAIETLLKLMEDNRGAFAVITAGYPDNMNIFLKSNPGLKSRFDKTYTLPDYNSNEMMDIAQSLLTKETLQLTEDAKKYLQQYFEESHTLRDKYFGNARSVRQAIESIITKQNLRLATIPQAQRTNEVIQQITLADVKHLTAKSEQKNNAIGFKRSEEA